MPMHHLGILAQRLRRAPIDDASLDENGHAIRKRQYGRNRLVHDDDGNSAVTHKADRAPYLVAHQWSQALGRLIQNEQPWIGHQCATDRQHLLFSAGKLIAAMTPA